MTVRKVLRLGHPLLRKTCQSLDSADIGKGSFKELVSDLFETMRSRDGIGLAASQVGRRERVIVYEIEANSRYENLNLDVEATVLINPRIIARSAERELDWEACLSLPALRGEVPRHSWIKIEALTMGGEKIERKVKGFEARVIQHEIDHLDGTLFIDRMYSMDKLSYEREYHKYHENDD